MRPTLLAAAAAAAALACAAGPAGAQPLPCSPPNAVTHTFTSPSQQVSWAVCWYDYGTKGLAITAAFLKTSATAPWRRVLWDLRVAEIFVPYHTGSPRYYDLSWGALNQLTAADCPASEGGTLLGPINQKRVCREIRNRGVAWRDHQGVRRGKELVLWASYDAGNYKYIEEYAFRDDGAITARLGSTGMNSPATPWEGHMHDGLFRADLDLNGWGLDRVKVQTHTETGAGATDADQLVQTETGVTWDDRAFTSLLIEDAALVNARGHPSGYILVPIRTGSARHIELWTQRDLWITRYSAAETTWDLPQYIGNQQSVVNTDVVVWYMGSAHHHPRDEDGQGMGPTFQGVAQVMWSGLMLVPHDWFNGPIHWP